MTLFVAYKSWYEITFTVYWYDHEPEKITGLCETSDRETLYSALRENYGIFREFAGLKINNIRKLAPLNIK